MIEIKKIRASVSCQVYECAGRKTLWLEDVRMFQSEPVCERCYEEDEFIYAFEKIYKKKPRAWNKLPKVKVTDLCE